MTSHAFGSLLDIESSPGQRDHHGIPIPSQKGLSGVHRTASQAHIKPLTVETPGLQFEADSPTPKTPTAKTLGELEMSRPSTPPPNEMGVGDEAVDAVMSWKDPFMNRYRMVAICLLSITQGLSDSAPGALIPYIQEQYGITYTIVSLIFITNAVGFILAAFFVDALRARLGRAKTMMVASVLVAIGYIPIVCTPPFPVVVVAFFPLGLGNAITLSMSNVFAANLQNGTRCLGCMHGSYGIGGTVGPLMATAMVTKGSVIWSRYYFIPLFLTIFNFFFSSWSFWHYEKEIDSRHLLTPLEMTASHSHNIPFPTATPRPVAQLKQMLQAFKLKTVLLGALFIFAYQGAEVSISGWVISFLIDTRNGNPSAVGYVTSGFWGGITVGRFLLSPVAQKIGEKRFVYGLIAGAIAFQLLVWLVPNIITDAVSVALVGLLIGPIYPSATVVFSRAIAKQDQINGLSVISAFGSSGGAVAPFVVGLAAQAVGTFVLHPIAIGLFVTMSVSWFALPVVRKRSD